jgi:hypothetical protein
MPGPNARHFLFKDLPARLSRDPVARQQRGVGQPPLAKGTAEGSEATNRGTPRLYLSATTSNLKK